MNTQEIKQEIESIKDKLTKLETKLVVFDKQILKIGEEVIIKNNKYWVREIQNEFSPVNDMVKETITIGRFNKCGQ